MDLRIGKVLTAQPVEGSEKLLRLEVDFGEFKRQILAGIAKFYNPEDVIGKLLPFIVNLEPRTMIGLESQGMLIAANHDGPVLLFPDKEVPEGTNLC